MLKIYLACHGQDENDAQGILSGRQDAALTKQGLDNVHELTRTIWRTGLHFDAIYSSPLQRAVRVAGILADTLELPKPIEREQLTERDCGVMTGEHYLDITERCAPDIMQSADTTYFLKSPGAETFPELLARARAALHIIRSDHPHGNVLVVSHNDMCKMLFAAYYELEWQPVLSMFHFSPSDLLELSETATPATAHIAS